MKLTRLILKRFRQFEDLNLNLTLPDSGRPLEKVCFIGRNATGKSTLLHILFDSLRHIHNALDNEEVQFPKGQRSFLALNVALTDESIWLCGFPPNNLLRAFRQEIQESDAWLDFVGGEKVSAFPQEAFSDFLLSGTQRSKIAEELRWKTDGSDLVVFFPPDGSTLLAGNKRLPETTLNSALGLFQNFAPCQKIRMDDVARLWNVLIFKVKEREKKWQEYLQRPDNRTKSVAQAEENFQSDHPDVLEGIAALWNRILEPVGLEFDYRRAKRPVQLNDNLEAFVNLSASGERIDYNAISSGIRNFIFRLGHVYSLYFQRQVRRGFLLVDEPENCLHPDFLYDLIDIYFGIIHNTQFFVATHNPIIAAQFRPQERIILEFDSKARVRTQRGVVPVGDDPNDALVKDFGVRTLYGKEGLAKWERFLELRRLIRRTPDPAERRSLIDEYMQIGSAYNFASDAIP
jgi:hypothetical protein